MPWPKLDELHPEALACLLRRTYRLTIWVYHRLNRNVPAWIMYQARQIHPTNRAIYGYLFSILRSLEAEGKLRLVIHEGNGADERDLYQWWGEALTAYQGKTRKCAS